jgi:hypothetical protein
MCGVEEAKRVFIRLRYKTDLGKSTSLYTRTVARLLTKPSHPQKAHLFCLRCLPIQDTINPGMKDTEKLTIPVWVSPGCCLGRVDHNKCSSSRIKRVLVPPNVVCCVVDTQCFGGVDFVVENTHSAEVFFGEGLVSVPIEISIEKPP